MAMRASKTEVSINVVLLVLTGGLAGTVSAEEFSSVDVENQTAGNRSEVSAEGLAAAGPDSPYYLDPAVSVVYEDDGTVTINGENLPLARCDILYDDIVVDRPMSYEEFMEENAYYIDFLSKTIGEKAACESVSNEYWSSRGVSSQRADRFRDFRSVSSKVRQIDGKDIYLWPYQSHTASTSDQSACSVSFVVFNANVGEFSDKMQNYGDWHGAIGLWDWGYRGVKSGEAEWTLSLPVLHQLENGNYWTERYHIVLTEGHYSNSLNDWWCYGECHWEYWDDNINNHVFYPHAIENGLIRVSGTALQFSTSQWISLYNAQAGVFNGYGRIFKVTG